MTDAQAPVEAAVPAAQALVQVPPVAAANVENPQRNQAPLRYNFCSLYCLGFSLEGVPPFAFPSPLSSTWLLVGTIFSIVFVPSFLFYLWYAYISLRQIWLFCSVLVPFCTPFIYHVSLLRLANTGFVEFLFIPFPSRLHSFCLLCECASPRKHRFCVVLLFLVPFPFLHTFVCLPVCFALPTDVAQCCLSFAFLWDFVRLSDLCTL